MIVGSRTLALLAGAPRWVRRSRHSVPVAVQPRAWTALPVMGAFLLLFLGLAAVLAPWLSPYTPSATVARPFTPPGAAHPLGTDDLGRDVLTSVLYGARVSLSIAVTVAAGSTFLAWSAGIAAGIWRRFEAPVLFLADLLIALPSLPLAMLIVLLAGASVQVVAVTLIVLTWPAFAKIVRAQVLAVRASPYVQAARSLGATEARVALRHVLPATLTLLPAKLVLTVRLALFGEATLAFLGLGDPSASSWGTMLGWAFNDPLLFTRGAWIWWVLPPAAAIALAVVATSWLATAFER